MWDAPVKRWHKWDRSKWVDPRLVTEVWAPLVMIWVIDPVLIRLQEVQVYLNWDNQLYLWVAYRKALLWVVFDVCVCVCVLSAKEQNLCTDVKLKSLAIFQNLNNLLNW